MAVAATIFYALLPDTSGLDWIVFLTVYLGAYTGGMAANLPGGNDHPELYERSIQGGIACELVQTGSLYHDDVMDEADTRRGVDTVNARWGNLQAILAGDFLLSRASEIAASLGTEVAALLARTIGRLCEGQIEELRHTYNSARPEASYLSSISGKTASLYATAARIGAPLGHDFCAINLSDNLKPWELVEQRLRLAAQGDFDGIIHQNNFACRNNLNAVSRRLWRLF